MSVECPRCKKGETLYRCPTCGVTGHVDKKKKEVIIHFPMPETFTMSLTPITLSFPRHFDCPLAQPVDTIDLSKLEKVKVKKQ